MLPGCVAIPTC